MLECPLPGPDAPPFGLGLRRPQGSLARLANRIAASVNNAAGAGFRREANAVRARHGLAPIQGTVTQHTGRLPLYIIPSTPSFDYQRRDLPPSVRYVGACSFNRPGGAEVPAWLDQLPEGRPWIHATEGTVQMGEPVLLRATAQALANEPVEVILTTGGTREPEQVDLGVRSTNVHLARFIPHDDLLPRVAAVVATGGAGAVAAALSHGIPLVCVPQEWDHAENAQRVVEAGAGLRLSWRGLTPERLRKAVRQVLEEPSFRHNAERLGRDFRGLGGPKRAAELLESLLQRREEDAHSVRPKPGVET
jgi:MGT family glycosyltransferase